MTEEQKTALNFNEINHLLPPNYSDMEISELEKLAEQGDLEAMRKLVEKLSPQSPSFLISDSDKPTPNPEEAFKWVLKLSEMGDHQGRHWLADCYFNGQCVDKADSVKAIGLLEKYAEEGDYIACVRLAYFYAHGKGVEQSFRKAIEWLEKMIAHEDANPSFKPHHFFSIKNAVILSWEFCPEFTYWYEEPRYKLAKLYLQGGFGIEQDFGKAVEWLEKASNWLSIPYGEKCRAQFKLGECYLTGGPGLEKSYVKAIEWFKEIPEPSLGPNGYSLRYRPETDEYRMSEEEKYGRKAQRQLGICHALGKGVEQDFAEAKKYFEKAARTSSVNACDIPPMVDPRAEAELGICLYRLGEIAEARKCFERSANKDDILGNLWLCYLNSVENEKLRGGIEYVPSSLRTTGNPFHKPSNDELQSKKIDEIESEIDRRLIDVAVSVESQVRKEEELNLDMLSVSDEVIEFLINRKNNLSTHPSKVILALYYQDKNNEFFLKYLKQASDHGDVIANYNLGKHYKNYNHNEAEKLLNMVAFVDLSYYAKGNYPLDILKELRYLAKGDLKDISHQKEIEEKNMELEDMMAMFAHKFRSPLDAIIYNTTHNNQPALYTEMAQTMRGLLDIFSLISTDSTILKQKLASDHQGKGRLTTVLNKTLDMILLHLLSFTSREKIRQHYIAYAKTHGLCLTDISRKEWREDYFELEQSLQVDWEQSFASLLKQSAPLSERLTWLAERFFIMDVRGFDREDIAFEEYGVTESLLTIVLSEVLINAFKYYSSGDNQSVLLEWVVHNNEQSLICHNPSIGNERTIFKGSQKGHTFLSALARNIGSHFTKPIPQDDFVIEFCIPNELLLPKL